MILAFCRADFSQSKSAYNLNGIKLLMIDGKYAEAVKSLDSLIFNDSTNVQALYYLGLNYEAVSSYVKAAEAPEAAVKYKHGDTKKS